MNFSKIMVAQPPPVSKNPDTVIKLFIDFESEDHEADDLREILDFLKRFGHLEGTLVLRLRENIQGNVFNQPYQYMMIRSIIPEDTLPSNLKNDGDPMSDFFCTLRKVQSRSAVGRRQTLHGVDPDLDKRAIILAFKVLDDDKTFMLDKTWKTWTGAGELLAQLTKIYKITGVTCFKGVNVIPDIFKYIVLIQLRLEHDQDDTYAMDCMQKFRIRRMSGYAALYSVVNVGSVERFLDFNLNGGDSEMDQIVYESPL